ncbi:hypothetical protein SODALDRAFT_329471 [Sodiomyces alkalinus F11]|uniref:Pentatricopeptide repeat domain-containing protein n=1 Tax=Sodiomyces alkalinus (strain CBS 110278 / VKM F-3762 / F11) TaxID=1314773 RepID=A0A3N2PJT6_SODAK|nr:hypothetical protein SODALDRAFT_329471 [Sodiomyces alkalinus F11]ROT34787.1 hypothetical protein SODALDRAFT_329471 [Sodiomyces alkalinus F11]
MPLVLQCFGRLNRASFGRSQPLHSLPTPPPTANSIPSAVRKLNYIRESPCADVEWAGLPTSTSNQPPETDTQIQDSVSLNPPDPNRFSIAAPDSRGAGTTRNPIYLPRFAKACETSGFGSSIGPGLLNKLAPREDLPSWVARLYAALRIYEEDGVPELWIMAKRHHGISSLKSPEAVHIWKTVLDTLLTRDASLEPIYDYALWLLDAHSIQLPDLYYRVVAHCLRSGKYHGAFYWHLRLMPDFDPGIDSFGSLLREFIVNSEVRLQNTLMSMYTASLHRGLYDRLIPYLFERGKLNLCYDWRKLLLRHRDVPKPLPTAQPFLRFLACYFPNKALTSEEKAVIGLSFPALPDRADSPNIWETLSVTQGKPGHDAGRRLNDVLGARWFASSWIPLDIAVHALRGLGVRNIGPLSLQSIAIREATPAAVTSRLEQLRNLGIDIGHSTYARAVRYFARSGNSELLTQLLRSDIHPDVFDDLSTQGMILRGGGGSTNSRHTSRLLLAVQPAAAQDSIETTSNDLLCQHLSRGQCRQAIGLLDDMRAMGLNIHPQTLHSIHQQLMRSLESVDFSATPDHGQQVSDLIALAKRVALLPGYLPSRFWQKVLFNLGKFGRLDELEHLAMYLVDDCQNRILRYPGRISVHVSDCPHEFTFEEARVGIPPDLPITSDWHPIRRIFLDHRLQASMVRWGFRKGLTSPYSLHRLATTRTGLRPSDFHVARGVRFLKELGSRGIPLDRPIIRKEVVRCIARYSLSAKGTPRDGRDDLDLNQMAMLFNFTFGDWLLPSAMELRDLMVKET